FGTKDFKELLKETEKEASEQNLKLIFVTANKSSNFRVYNFEIDPTLEANKLKLLNPLVQITKYPVKNLKVAQIKYRNHLNRELGIEKAKLHLVEPTIIHNPFNPKDSFILVTTRLVQKEETSGTQKPILYEIQLNNSQYDDVISVLANCLTGLSFTVWESLVPTRLPSPLHYAHKLARLCSQAGSSWNEDIDSLMFV
ncbi:MAG: Piwi domain-containing protein, partial [Candidatus Hodarchaeota archaeon]